MTDEEHRQRAIAGEAFAKMIGANADTLTQLAQVMAACSLTNMETIGIPDAVNSQAAILMLIDAAALIAENKGYIGFARHCFDTIAKGPRMNPDTSGADPQRRN